MNKYFKFEPVATLAALQVLAQTIIIAVVFTTGITVEAVAVVEGVNAALFGFLATFVRGAVVPTATLDLLKKLTPEQIKELAALDF